MNPALVELSTPHRRVRMFRAGEEVDCFVVLTRRYAVVVDTFGTPEEAAQVMEAARADLEGRQLLVINTHQHYDHAWGNAVFALDGPYPASILAHEKGLAAARASTGKLATKQAQEARFANVRIAQPTLTFNEQFQIHGGDLSLELIPAPGHAEDQVVMWIPEIKTLLAADALEFPFPEVEVPDQLSVLLQTIQTLKTLGATTILPCHGGRRGPELISRNLGYFATLERHLQHTKPQLPEGWEAREDLPQLVGLPFEGIVSEMGLNPAQVPDLYREFHRINVRATLMNL